ncbi:histidine kinase [Winogradskyella sp. PG-2]|uniref:histidine kinase n=1 Tax=Winogradskyella sp. PG-2 TaxID=754409 RepID=UPI000458984D|nr:histidine kinase [Winogradskyella sp. PG-2]BAO74252.1 putative two-component system sensor protein histidine kinase [Winogradskyella sp. PG-2]
MSKSVKNIVITFLIGCAIFILGELISGDMFQYDNMNEFLIEFGFYQLYSFVLGYANMVFFDYMEKRNWKKGDTLKRIIIGILGAVIITLILIFFLRAFISIGVYGEDYQAFIDGETWSGYSFGLWITLLIVSVFHIIYFYNRYQKNKIKEQKVIAGAASAKFDALKNQLDPHFLFNSLNVLTSLIEENPDNAQRFTTSLSKVYRYVLEQKNKELVTVDEELNFARTYMSLLKMRFEDSIIFEIPDKASNPESKVVPLSLQLLLENAVKHNMVTSSKPLNIKIYEDGNHLVVMNNLQPKQIVKKSSGVGLENIKQRYNLLSDRKVYINQRDKDFAVAIPMLTKQVSIMRTTQKSQERLNDDYVRARKRVEELKAFYYSLISYVFVIPFLIFIWYTYSRHTIQWFWFPMFGWGLSLVIQAYRVFVDNGAFGANWEKKKIEEYMNRDDQNSHWN